jgi:hypothetical protein
MQEIWLAGLDWDHVLPNNLATNWEKWLSELSDLSTVAHLVCLYDDSMSTSRFIASTCRVVPVKAITIPGLQLMGALLSCRLAQRLLGGC